MFLNVSYPINAVLASFDVLVFNITDSKTRLSFHVSNTAL